MAKRKAYCKKQNYKIIITENRLYESDEKHGCWLTLYNPKPNKTIKLNASDKTLNKDDYEDEEDDDVTTNNVTNRKQPLLNGTCFI